MAVCFDPVLGDMRMRDESNGPQLSFKLDGEALEADVDGVVDIPSATTTRKGVVKLNASTNSTSQSEAATPSAVRSAYQLANTANISSAKTGSDNYFSGENWFGNKVSFEGEVGFRTIPHATSEGKCGLTFFNDYGEVVGDFSAFMSLYDPESGEYTHFNEIFSDYAVRKALVAHGYDPSEMWATFDPWNGDPIYASLYFGGTDRTWPFYKHIYDEETGESTQEFWRNIFVSYASGAWQYAADEWVDGESGWRRYWFDLYLADAGTGDEVGFVTAWLSWKIRPGAGIEVRFETAPEFYLTDPETGDPVYAYPEGGFPWTAYASSAPDSPFYDPQYEGAEYMGWSPADNSAFATESSCDSAIEAAVAAHDSAPGAHPAIAEAAKRWNVVTTAGGGMSETLYIVDRGVHYSQNSMYAGGDCELTIRFPDRVQNKACEFYIIRFQTGWSCKLKKPTGMYLFQNNGGDAFSSKGIGLHLWHFIEFRWNPNNEQNPRCFLIEYQLLDRSLNSQS